MVLQVVHDSAATAHTRAGGADAWTGKSVRHVRRLRRGSAETASYDWITSAHLVRHVLT